MRLLAIGMAYVVRQFKAASPEYKQALDLRYRVLRKPLGLEFTQAELSKDEHDLHFGLMEDNRMVACLTLTVVDAGGMKMRQVAVDDALQGKGLGKVLATAAEDYTRQQGISLMFCHARKVAVPFYLKLGYEITGPEFTEVGIPHYRMQKRLL